MHQLILPALGNAAFKQSQLDIYGELVLFIACCSHVLLVGYGVSGQQGLMEC